MIKISCCQYQVEKLADWQSYTNKIESLVLRAKQNHSHVLMLPEYAGLESICGHFSNDAKLFAAMQSVISTFIAFYQALAERNQMYILPGTLMQEVSPRKYVNRAYFFSPDGSYGYQDKLQLIEYEKNSGLFSKGENQKIFDTSFGKVGIAICYDSEFPEIVRSLVKNGANIILVPSYTTTLAGYHRVFLSCRARAIENQCYVAISYMINSVDLSDETDMTVGQAAILGPADIGFPDDGIIAQGQLNEVMMITGEVSLEKLEKVRQEGHVHNYFDSKKYY